MASPVPMVEMVSDNVTDYQWCTREKLDGFHTETITWRPYKSAFAFAWLKKEMALTNNDSILTIHYNDKNVKIDPHQQMNIKWINGKNGIKSSAETKKAKYLNLDLPIVSFRHIERLPKSGMPRAFKMPSSYVQCGTEEEEANDDETEYDLDREDLAWLQLANARRRKIGCHPIDESILEKAIDMLEKESHFQFTQDEHGYGLGYLTMVDNDAPCCICNDGEDSNANQIIFCDICNIAVHQECYGVPYIPEGQWLCRRCQMSPSVPVNCALCPCTSGAFKQTSDGRWVHVVCAIWLNEVHFANTVFLEPVEGVDFSIKRRRKLKCLICKRKMGACLQCSNKACVRSFHATCARFADMKMVVKESRARNNPDSITINRFAYCFQHSNPNRNDQSVAVWKREMESKMQAARKIIDNNAKQTLKMVPLPVIPKEKVQGIAQQLGLNYLNDIYAYWSLKRKSRSGVPLIRRLQVYMNQQKPMLGRPFVDSPELEAKVLPDEARTTTTAPTMAEAQAAPTKGSSILDDPYNRFVALRGNFERVRLLCELVKKREKMKRDELLANKAIACQTMQPMAMLFDQTLAKLIEKDHQKVFTGLINEKRVPGSFSTISQPMDFQQMRANLDKDRYKRIAQMRDDFLLLIQNFTTLNKNNINYYNYGQRIKRIGLTVLKAAEVEEQRMNEFSNMKTQAIESPILSTEAFFYLNNELKLHNSDGLSDVNDKTAPENAKTTPTTKIKCTSEKIVHPQQDSNRSNSRLRKWNQASSSSATSAGGEKTAALSQFSEKTNASNETPSVSTAESSGPSTNILPKQGNNNSNKKATTEKNRSRLKRSHSKANSMPKTPRNAGKGNSTVATTSTSEDTAQYKMNSVDEQKQQRQMTTQKRRTVTRSSSRGGTNNKTIRHTNTTEKREQNMGMMASPIDNIKHQKRTICSKAKDKKGISKRQLSNSFLSLQQKSAVAAAAEARNKIMLRKKNYVNAYHTEASSAAESDSGNCDEHLLFGSMPEHEEDDELPSTVTVLDNKIATTPRRCLRAKQARKYLHIEDAFVPSSPPSSLFTHNDIVMVQDFEFPGRVIDIRMRAIDIEDEEEDDNSFDSICGFNNQTMGNSNNFGAVGRHFIDYALQTKPTQQEMSRQPHTLILFFDNYNTCKWVPNDRIRLLYENGLSNKGTEKDRTLVEAFERARRFWKNVIHP